MPGPNTENTMPSNAVIIGFLGGLGAERGISAAVVLATTLAGNSPAKELGIPLYVTLEILALISSGVVGALAGKAYDSREDIKSYCKAGWNNFCGYFARPNHAERMHLNVEDAPTYKK